MKRVSLEPAYILHSRAYRETSVLLDVFSQSHGRFSLLAKGIRKKNNRLAGMLQPFVPLMISFSDSGELAILQDADIRDNLYFITGNALIAGLYLNELLVNFLQKGDAYTGLFHLYENTLMGLQASLLDEKIIRSFEKKLLDELGYGLFPRSKEALLTAWQPDAFYRFLPTTGWVKCDSNEMHRDFSYSGETLLAIANDNFADATILQQAKRLMRQVLTELMNNKTIYSRQMFVKIWEPSINDDKPTDFIGREY